MCEWVNSQGKSFKACWCVTWSYKAETQQNDLNVMIENILKWAQSRKCLFCLAVVLCDQNEFHPQNQFQQSYFFATAVAIYSFAVYSWVPLTFLLFRAA